eukprot:gene27969-8851_t
MPPALRMLTAIVNSNGIQSALLVSIKSMCLQSSINQPIARDLAGAKPFSSQVNPPNYTHPISVRPANLVKRNRTSIKPQAAASDASVTLAERLTLLTKCYSDPKANSKFLVLVVGQALCSIATLIHESYLPVYAQDVLGLSNTKSGLVFGTFLTFLCKPMFVMLSNVHGVFGATAWMSKGIREAPTKAIMNELAKESGDAPDAAYGLRQSLATAGMLIGSTIAAVTFTLTGQNYIATFAVAMIPPLLALIWMLQNFGDEVFGKGAFAKKKSEPPPPPLPNARPTLAGQSLDDVELSIDKGDTPVQEKIFTFREKAWALLTAFKPAYWQALLVVSVLYFARFDASFLSLRAKSVMSKSALPMLTLTNSIIQVLLTAPLARYSGKCVANRNTLLMVGFAVMVCTNICFGWDVLARPEGMFLGAACLGLHMAMTHAITVSMVASYMPHGVVPGIGKIGGTAVSFTDLLLDVTVSRVASYMPHGVVPGIGKIGETAVSFTDLLLGFVLVGSNMMAGILSDWTRQQGLGNLVAKDSVPHGPLRRMALGMATLGHPFHYCWAIAGHLTSPGSLVVRPSNMNVSATVLAVVLALATMTWVHPAGAEPMLVREDESGVPILNSELRPGLDGDMGLDAVWRKAHSGWYSVYSLCFHLQAPSRQPGDTHSHAHADDVNWKVQASVIAATKIHKNPANVMLDPIIRPDGTYAPPIYKICRTGAPPDYKVPAKQLEMMYADLSVLSDFRAKLYVCAVYQWFQASLEYLLDLG